MSVRASVSSIFCELWEAQATLRDVRMCELPSLCPRLWLQSWEKLDVAAVRFPGQELPISHPDNDLLLDLFDDARALKGRQMILRDATHLPTHERMDLGGDIINISVWGGGS